MLEELLKYKSLGTKDEISFVLFHALPLANGQEVVGLKKYCIANRFAIGADLDGSLKLLEFMGLISVADGKVALNVREFNPAVIQNRETYLQEVEFVGKLLRSLQLQQGLAEFISPEAVGREPGTGLFSVKESLVPLRYFGVRNLLLSLGFFQRDEASGPGNLLVAPDFTELFEELILAPLKAQRKRRRRSISLSQLKEQIRKQEEAGAEAELFVLDFERQRLNNHPLIAEIRRVSEEQTNAGYDIESLNSLESVLVDRYIEVKSYAGEVAFYWSENEVGTAKELGDGYYLYLIDRDCMGRPGYAPRQFQNPYQLIFLNETWTKEATNWRISRHLGD